MLSLGRQGQLYGIAEVTQGTVPALAASNALRHMNFQINYDPVGRVPINEKTTGVGNNTTSRMDNRAKADYVYEGLFRPSGVLNTLPEQAFMLEAGFGTLTNTTLSTTFSGTPTASTGTVASAAGLAVGRGILITCPDGKKRIRQLTAVSGTDLTWAPNLPAGQAPAAAAACKAVINYSLSSSLIKTFAFAHYLKFTDGTAGLARAARMCVADKLGIEVDANGSPMLKVSGPCKDQTTAAAQPGGFTTVGTVPPSGISGDLMIGNNALKFLKFAAEITNAMYLRNEEYGEASASEAFRGGRRSVALTLDTYHENQASLYDLAMTGTYVPVFFQGGYTEGNCFALRCPTAELKLPTLDDPDTPVKAPYKGVALESAGNDEIYLFIA